MGTFINDLDFLFDEKGLITTLYQLYTSTKFALKYNKSLMFQPFWLRKIEFYIILII